MFRGAQEVTKDAKGRIMLPAKLRQLLDASNTSELVVTIDVMEHCLLAYPMKVWEKIEQALLALPNLESQTRQLQRLLIGHATELSPDAQGRILIPAMLSDYATLNKEVILLGQGNKFEIWDATHWHERRQAFIDERMDDQSLNEVLKGVSL